MTQNRDDFTQATRKVLAARVGHRCSRPSCGAPTAGPQLDTSKSLNLGVAAHITAASEGGPRYDRDLTPEQRCGIDNAIWLCQNCAKLIDNDESRYTVETIRDWKRQAEEAALEQIGKTFPLPSMSRLTPALSDKLRVSAPPPDPEVVALEIIMGQGKFYMRVIKLIDDVSHLPDHAVTNIARPPAYQEKKRALYEKFNEDYTRFMADMERAIDLLESVREKNAARIQQIIDAVRHVASTVAALVDWAEDPRNEPIYLSSLHPEINPRVRVAEDAKQASMHLFRNAGYRLLELRAG